MKKTTIIVVLCAVLLLAGGTVFLFTKILPDTATMGNTASNSSDSSKNSATLQSTDNTSINTLPANDDFIKTIPKNIKDIPSDWVEGEDDTLDKTKTAIYKDKQGAEYTFNKENGKIIEFTKILNNDLDTETSSNLSTKRLDELKNISDNFLKEFIQFEEYTYVDATNLESLGIYSFMYTRYLDGYKSMDFADVMIDYSGNIISLSTPNVGIFDNIDISKINKRKIEKNVKDQIKQRSKAIKDYTIEDMILRINDSGKLEMMANVLYTTNDGYKAGDAFFVPLED